MKPGLFHLTTESDCFLARNSLRDVFLLNDHLEHSRYHARFDFWCCHLIPSAPLYHRDPDVVAAAVPGKIPGFCTIYHNHSTGGAITVQVGVAVEHWQSGLGKALMRERNAAAAAFWLHSRLFHCQRSPCRCPIPFGPDRYESDRHLDQRMHAGAVMK